MVKEVGVEVTKKPRKREKKSKRKEESKVAADPADDF